jgi:hypothetical protein
MSGRRRVFHRHHHHHRHNANGNGNGHNHLYICLLPLLFLSFPTAFGQSIKNVHLGFPEAWDGDKFPQMYCPSKNIPKFLGNSN